MIFCGRYRPEGWASDDPRRSVIHVPFLPLVPYGECDAGGTGVVGDESVDVDDDAKRPQVVLSSHIPPVGKRIDGR